VGDIHGCYKLLKKELRKVGFNPKRDRLFSVGDIIDRGPQSIKCLSLLDEKWFYMVRGNHEQMLIEAHKLGRKHGFWKNTGKWTKKLSDKELAKWVERLDDLPIAMTLKIKNASVGICHAETDGRNWKKSRDKFESINAMLWGRRVLRRKPKFKVKGVDFTIHGHTPLRKPKWVKNRYFLDTGSNVSKNLTVVNIKDLHKEYKRARKAA